MKGSAFLPIVAAAITPLLLVGLIVVGSTLGLVLWRPPVLWTDQFGDTDATSSVTKMSSGDSGVFVAGYLNTNGTPLGNAFLRRYDSTGNIVWTDMIQAGSQFFIWGIYVGSDGVYVLPYGNVTLSKYDFNGNQLWNESEASVGLSFLSSTDGGIYAAGGANHPVTNQSFTGPVEFVREYDPDGKVVWTSEFSNSTSIYAGELGIYAGASGVFVLNGLSLAAFSLTGNELWAHAFGSPGFVIPLSVSGDSTGVYVSGIVRATALSLPTGFLTKYDFGGNVIWDIAFDTPDAGGVGGVSNTKVSDASSGVYLSIVTGRGNDFVYKYDLNGNNVLSFQTPVKPKGDNFLIAPSPNGFYLAGATFSSTGWRGLVQAFSGSSSLIFFGINPPLSFIVLATMIVVAVLAIIVLRKRYASMMSKRPKSASNFLTTSKPRC